jgi:hypothetical protein
MALRRAIPTLFILAVFVSTLLADERRDGNWWRRQDALGKLDYVTGFFDGMQLGHRFSYWKNLGAFDKTCATKAVESYGALSDAYVKHLTVGQVSDGLNQFYSDYRNRTILIHDAVWLVLNGIAGTPEQEMKEMIESYRRAAAKQ